MAAAGRAGGRAVQVINLGRMGFLEAHNLQMRYARPHLEEMAGKPNVVGVDTLLLVEHNPVYTIGLRTKDYDQVDERRLKNLGAEFYRTNRGGLITFHGPGQLVAYPILNLKRFQLGVRKYVEGLELTLIDTCRHFGLQARTTQHTGVWVDDSKIAAIGIHASRFITSHGVALNCNTDLEWFRHVVPCGIEGKAVTSISHLLDTRVAVRKAVDPFLAAFQERFDCQIDTTLLMKTVEEGLGMGKEEGTVVGGQGHPPSMQGAAQQQQQQQGGVRLLSTSASAQSQARTRARARARVPTPTPTAAATNPNEQVRPRVSMW